MDREDLKPGAFMCYARINDRDGTLTKLRKNLSDEIEEYIGEKFPIFQDVEDIRWGEDWKERIDESLSEVTFFIPIITPSFFKSSYCCDELNRFLERERKLGRNDLVLPIYYIETPLLENEAERESSDQDGDSERDIKTLARIINDRQRPSCADWRKLRPKCRNSFNSVEIYEYLESLAIQIRDALDQLPPMKIRPIVVDQAHRGDYATISDAIKAASPVDTISVRPGLYREGLVIDKPLEIVGEGERDEIEIQAMGSSALLFKTTNGRVANLTLHQMGGEGTWYGVDIAQGKLTLEDCDISSQSTACVAIHDGADPLLRRNKIHDGKKCGVFVFDNGKGTLEENEIFRNAKAGVEISKGGNPTMRKNRIYDGKDGGVIIYDNGKGMLEENEIFGNKAGVAISKGGRPTLRRNKINKNKFLAISIHDGGEGIIEENDLRGNADTWFISGDGSKIKRSSNLE